jgi:hypothetical protein
MAVVTHNGELKKDLMEKVKREVTRLAAVVQFGDDYPCVIVSSGTRYENGETKVDLECFHRSLLRTPDTLEEWMAAGEELLNERLPYLERLNGQIPSAAVIAILLGPCSPTVVARDVCDHLTQFGPVLKANASKCLAGCLVFGEAGESITPNGAAGGTDIDSEKAVLFAGAGGFASIRG